MGSIKSAAARKTKLHPAVVSYLKMVKKCATCSAELPYEKRLNKYCNHSCAAKTANSINVVSYFCETCNSKIAKGNRFCSHDCRAIANHKETDSKFELGILINRQTIKNVYVRRHGYSCTECDIFEWRGHKLSLELDHKDGDASNNLPSNLQLLCPNCHSTTSTWKGRNVGFGRKSRGLSTS